MKSHTEQEFDKEIQKTMKEIDAYLETTKTPISDSDTIGVSRGDYGEEQQFVPLSTSKGLERSLNYSNSLLEEILKSKAFDGDNYYRILPIELCRKIDDWKIYTQQLKQGTELLTTLKEISKALNDISISKNEKPIKPKSPLKMKRKKL